MTDIELFRNKRVKILLVSGAIETDEQAELANAVALTQGFELWKIDKDNIVQSLNAAIELHKSNDNTSEILKIITENRLET